MQSFYCIGPTKFPAFRSHKTWTYLGKDQCVLLPPRPWPGRGAAGRVPRRRRDRVQLPVWMWCAGIWNPTSTFRSKFDLKSVVISSAYSHDTCKYQLWDRQHYIYFEDWQADIANTHSPLLPPFLFPWQSSPSDRTGREFPLSMQRQKKNFWELTQIAHGQWYPGQAKMANKWCLLMKAVRSHYLPLPSSC